MDFGPWITEPCIRRVPLWCQQAHSWDRTSKRVHETGRKGIARFLYRRFVYVGCAYLTIVANHGARPVFFFLNDHAHGAVTRPRRRTLVATRRPRQGGGQPHPHALSSATVGNGAAPASHSLPLLCRAVCSVGAYNKRDRETRHFLIFRKAMHARVIEACPFRSGFLCCRCRAL